jgi:hypothetical protein
MPFSRTFLESMRGTASLGYSLEIGGRAKSISWAVVRLRRMTHCWQIQKVGKDTTKTRYISHSVWNIDHFLCLGKLEHTYKSQTRQQYLLKTCFHAEWCACDA